MAADVVSQNGRGNLGPTTEQLDELQAALAGERVQGTTLVRRFVRLASGARCAVVGCRRPGVEGDLSFLTEFRRRSPLTPIVLVTRRHPDLAQATRSLVLAEVVWWDEARSALRPAVQRATTRNYFHETARAIEGSDLPPLLRRGVAHALRAVDDRPVRSPTELARMVSCSRVTLSQELHVACPDLTLHDLLDRLQVIRGLQLRASGLSWEGAAKELSIHRDTLYRKARRWPACTLRELKARPLADLVQRFDDEAIRPLLTG